MTFASEGELLGHWLGVIHLEIARDWTWDGRDDEGFVVSRRDRAGDPLRVIGHLPVPFTVPTTAVSGADIPGTDRRASTRLIFFDAVDPNPPAGRFPTTPTPEWTIEPRIRGFAPPDNEALTKTLGCRLPVAVRPRQTPKLVSAGIALSPYNRPTDYSTTEPRRRVLWFELDTPVEDPNDALFARVLAYGPDPLLSGAITHLLLPVPDLPVGPTTLFEIVERQLPTPPDPPPLAIDDESMRVIVPDQPEDVSGLDSMLDMTEATPLAGEARARHFQVPLPDVDPDAPDLFGFWTYELRVGHDKIWSNAQARWGRPLVIKGVQHPAPRLECSAFRVQTDKPIARRIVVTAPFATAVFDDQRLTRPEAGDPRTRIWVLLYAQVMQADGSTRRNVLLARTPAVPRFDRNVTGAFDAAPATRDVIGVAEFDTPVIERTLADLALPADAPLSAIAVELLPSDHLAQQETAIRLGDKDVKLYTVFDTPDVQSGDGSPVAGVLGQGSDPLGRELGTMSSRRILRCSPLTPVAPAC